jgi:hypothetical protein
MGMLDDLMQSDKGVFADLDGFGEAAVYIDGETGSETNITVVLRRKPQRQIGDGPVLTAQTFAIVKRSDVCEPNRGTDKIRIGIRPGETPKDLAVVDVEPVGRVFWKLLVR